MPSRLVNLRHNMTWSDFRGPVPRNATLNAQTAVDIVFSGLAVDRGTSGVTLRDSVVVTVALRHQQCWAKPGAARTAALLNHEQGHYDITALTARDLFIDLMQLKQQTFRNAQALQTEINRIRRTYNPQAIQDKYDELAESDHGRNAAGQRRWDGYIRRAFTEARTPPMRAPDGAIYKVRLRDVLRAAGKLSGSP